MNTFKLIVISSAVMAATSTLVGCAGNKVKEIETKLEMTQITSSGETIGVNKDDVAIIQKKTMAADELNRLTWQINGTEWKIGLEVSQIKNCREDMADPRLGGNGNIVPIPAVDGMKKPERKEEFGIVNGSLQFVTTEDLLKRVAYEREYQRTVEKLLGTVEDAREDCERKMRIARRKAGLPSDRTIGIVKYDSEGRVTEVVKKGENSLDTAFELVKEAKVAEEQ
jgi:hypothetical protein